VIYISKIGSFTIKLKYININFHYVICTLDIFTTYATKTETKQIVNLALLGLHTILSYSCHELVYLDSRA